MRRVRQRRLRQELDGREAAGHVVLTFVIHEEDGKFVSQCQELGVGSFGRDLDEAIMEGIDAVLVYLQEVTDTGEIGRVFEERGIRLHPGAPELDAIHDAVNVTARPGEVVSPRAVPVPALAGVG